MQVQNRSQTIPLKLEKKVSLYQKMINLVKPFKARK